MTMTLTETEPATEVAGFELTDDHKRLVAEVRDFADRVVAPAAYDYDTRREPAVPHHRRDGRDGTLRSPVPGRVRRTGQGLPVAVPRGRAARTRRPEHRRHTRSRRRPRGHAHLPPRHRGAEAGMAADAHVGHGARRVRPHRSRRRIGCGRHQDDRNPPRRPVDHQRHQAVHHQLGQRHHPAGHASPR